MKKLLVLGGTRMQIPVMKHARSLGHKVISCDYLPDNPGHSYSDEYHNVSTTDQNAVLELSRRLAIDGILAFASDPAAPTAAFVADQLGLPGAGQAAVESLSDKGQFRQLLHRLDLPAPDFCVGNDLNQLQTECSRLKLPAIVKPVDSSGSKGVGRLDKHSDLPPLFHAAAPFSRTGNVIVEEYIDGPQLHGDGFVLDGSLKFCLLGDHHFNGIVNSSTFYPSSLSRDPLDEIERQVRCVLSAVNFRGGGINIEARVRESDGQVFLIEIGPRNGGHFTHHAIELACGFDLVQAAVDHALDAPYRNQQVAFTDCAANLVLYASTAGRLKSIEFLPGMPASLVAVHLYKSPGDLVESSWNSANAVGVALLKFAAVKHMHEFMRNPSRFAWIAID
jgi:biotin carboxylase